MPERERDAVWLSNSTRGTGYDFHSEADATEVQGDAASRSVPGDLTKAFDSVSRPGLWWILNKIGCPSWQVQADRSIFSWRYAWPGNRRWRNVHGLRYYCPTKHGCVFAPLFFVSSSPWCLQGLGHGCSRQVQNLISNSAWFERQPFDRVDRGAMRPLFRRMAIRDTTLYALILLNTNFTKCVIIMAALWNRTGHYNFVLWFLSSFFFIFFSTPNLSDRRLDVYHTCTHGWP